MARKGKEKTKEKSVCVCVGGGGIKHLSTEPLTTQYSPCMSHSFGTPRILKLSVEIS